MMKKTPLEISIKGPFTVLNYTQRIPTIEDDGTFRYRAMLFKEPAMQGSMVILSWANYRLLAHESIRGYWSEYDSASLRLGKAWEEAWDTHPFVEIFKALLDALEQTQGKVDSKQLAKYRRLVTACLEAAQGDAYLFGRTSKDRKNHPLVCRLRTLKEQLFSSRWYMNEEDTIQVRQEPKQQQTKAKSSKSATAQSGSKKRKQTSRR
jgi:hypothetical protein